jgi:hypothetical protein
MEIHFNVSCANNNKWKVRECGTILEDAGLMIVEENTDDVSFFVLLTDQSNYAFSAPVFKLIFY